MQLLAIKMANKKVIIFHCIQDKSTSPRSHALLETAVRVFLALCAALQVECFLFSWSELLLS